MKIGIFTDAYNPVTSGVVTSINMVEQELKKRGHEVYIFTTSKSIQPNDHKSLYMLGSMPLLIARQYKNRVATFYSRKVAKQIKKTNNLFKILHPKHIIYKIICLGVDFNSFIWNLLFFRIPFICMQTFTQFETIADFIIHTAAVFYMTA